MSNPLMKNNGNPGAWLGGTQPNTQQPLVVSSGGAGNVVNVCSGVSKR